MQAPISLEDELRPTAIALAVCMFVLGAMLTLYTAHAQSPSLVLGQAPAIPEWARILDGVTALGLLGFVIWFVFARLIPNREEANLNAREQARRDFLEHLKESRTDYLGNMSQMRDAFLTEMERQRAFYREGAERTHDSLQKMNDLLQRIAATKEA